MKRTLDWYRHDAAASDSPKLIALRASPYGWAGEGRFWALCGFVAAAEDCRLDLSRKFARPGIAKKLDYSIEELDAFLVFLRDECELAEYDGAVVSMERLREALEDVMPERERKADFARRRKSSADVAGNVRASSALVARSVRASSEENDPNSAEKYQNSALSNHRAEAEADTEAEQSREPAGQVIHREEVDDFSAFCLEVAIKERKARSPARLAATLAADPVIRARYEASRPRADDVLPEPPPCDCGGAIHADRTPLGGSGQCRECETWWYWDPTGRSWVRNNEEF